MVTMTETVDSKPPDFAASATPLAAMGYAVFPVVHNEKGPLTVHGCLDATTETAQIDAWADMWPNANVGIHAAGLIVVDRDILPDGSENPWPQDRSQRDSLYVGPVARTPRGGEHHYFRVPAGMKFRNSASKVAPKVDIRTTGGYVVAPPSIANDRQYQWINELRCTADELPEAPPWLVSRLNETTFDERPAAAPWQEWKSDAAVLERARRYIAKIPGAVSGQGGSNVTFRTACILVLGFGLPIEDAYGLIEEWNQTCTPPWTERELRHKLDDANKRGGDRGYMRNADPANYQQIPIPDYLEPNSGNSELNVNCVYAPEEWLEPIPLGADEVADFPTDAISEPARSYIRELSEFTQTPPDLAGGMFLAAAGVAVQKKIDVELAPGWNEQLSIYCLSAMDPANRKSAVVSRIAQPIRLHETRVAEQMGPAIRDSVSTHEVLTKQRMRLLDDVAKAIAGPDRDALANELRMLDETLASHVVLSAPTLLVDDVTPEHLATKMARNGGRMGILTPEGDIFDILCGRYSGGAGANIGIVLKSHCGDEVRVDRGNRPSEHIKHPAISMGCCVQPEVLRGLLQKRELRGKGMLARYLYQIPTSLLGRRKTSPAPVKPETEFAYSQLMDRLLNIPAETGQDGEFKPFSLTLTTAARGLFQEFMGEIEASLGEFGELATIRDWGGKLPGAVARIAGLLHIVANADCPMIPPQVTEGTMSDAIWIGRYLISHANAAFSMMGKNECVGMAEHIINTAKKLGMNSFTKRDMHQQVRRRVEKPDDLDQPLRLLVDHNYIREVPQVAKGPGRKPSPLYEINPRVTETNS